MSSNTLLIEIGTEELPPGSLRNLAESMHREVVSRLAEQRIVHADSRWFATPRRLAVMLDSVAAVQTDAVVEKLGPAVAAAFDADGKPTPAATGFARGCGVGVEALVRVTGERGERLAFRQAQPGQLSTALIPAIVSAALAALPIARRMRWGARRAEFVRPVHWVVLLYGKQVVYGNVLGVETGRETRGHRVLGEARIALGSASEYAAALLERGSVVADYAVRKQRIEVQVSECARAIGGNAALDDALLEEVCSLVEWPCALAGRFDERFLDVPAEALISSMKQHQKYFHVTNEAGKLLPYFITVANIVSRDPAQVIAGNERVIRPRLADAAFFFAQDQNTSLWARRDSLRNIVFQTDLGSLWDKTERVARLAALTGAELGADTAQCERAARISKSDLVSDMVLEFADLQGIMGSYYARHDGEDEAVVSAMREQYLPRHAGDVLAKHKIGITLAIADRIDTLVGIFGIGQAPTGSRDPFALRRAALGVLRTIVENQLPLDLQTLLENAAAGHAKLPQRAGVVAAVRDYMLERMRAWYGEAGISAECFMAVHARGTTQPYDFDCRIRAVTAFMALPESLALASANKRVANILSKPGGGFHPADIDQALLCEPAEQQLATQLAQAVALTRPLLAGADYTGALQVLARLREPVDCFFEQVMVMCDDPALRQNRLALLAQLRNAFLAVADVSALAMNA